MHLSIKMLLDYKVGSRTSRELLNSMTSLGAGEQQEQPCMGADGLQAHQLGVQRVNKRLERLLAVLLVPVEQGVATRQRSKAAQQVRRVRYARAGWAVRAQLQQRTARV